jgi:hypothetical protein
MKLEAGKKYRTESGLVVGPLMFDARDACPFYWYAGNLKMTWSLSGKYYPDMITLYDIVSELEAEPPISLEIGEWYQMRNGRIVNDLQICCDTEYPFFSKTHRMTWTGSGKWWLKDDKLRDTDLVKHIKKENPMKNPLEETVKTLEAEVEKLKVISDEYHKLKAKIESQKNEVGKGDWFIYCYAVLGATRKALYCCTETDGDKVIVNDLTYHQKDITKLDMSPHIKNLLENYFTKGT